MRGGSVTVFGGLITLGVETGFFGILLRRGREEQIQRRGWCFGSPTLPDDGARLGTRLGGLGRKDKCQGAPPVTLPGGTGILSPNAI